MQECMESIKKHQAFEPGKVQMLDSYCANAFEKETEYLKKIDIGRLLAGFYENAGIVSPKIRYGGWEDSLIGGHTMGHFLTAISQAYANAACKKEDKDLFLSKVKEIVDALLECQANTKGKPGFIFGATITNPKMSSFSLTWLKRTGLIFSKKHGCPGIPCIKFWTDW